MDKTVRAHALGTVLGYTRTMVKEVIVQTITSVLKKVGVEIVEVSLEHPADLSHGDYSSNVALVVSKALKKNPKILADEIVGAIKNIDGVERIEIAGAGFINFYLSRKYFSDVTEDILNVGQMWGRNDFQKGKTIVVDHTQPNPFKPFHIGHLMSNATGESISRLLIASGANVKRVNYQGDIGLHVAKCLWAVMKEGGDTKDINALGTAYVTGAKAYEENPDAKAEIDVLNVRLYGKDPELMKLYEEGRKTSLKHFDELYSVLGSEFDRLYMESETVPLGLEAVADGLQRGILEKSDGAIVSSAEKNGLHTRVFVTSKGLPTYEGKELGLVQLKRDEFSFDLAITTIAMEQDSYFKVVENVVEALWPELKDKYIHAPFGMMLLTSGKMSSRKGNVITGESLIEEMRTKVFEKMTERDLGDLKQKIADEVAVAAIKYSILKQAKGKNIVFDPEASLSFDGDSGPYLQYAHVRALSVLRKAETAGIAASPTGAPDSVSELERLLYRFPEVVERAEKEYEPHYLTTFLTELASAFSSWYAKEQIVSADDPTSPYKIALTQAFATTMKNGLWLLGIKAPEKM